MCNYHQPTSTLTLGYAICTTDKRLLGEFNFPLMNLFALCNEQDAENEENNLASISWIFTNLILINASGVRINIAMGRMWKCNTNGWILFSHFLSYRSYTYEQDNFYWELISNIMGWILSLTFTHPLIC